MKARYRDLFTLLKDSWLSMLLSVICMLVLSATTAAQAYIIKPVLDDVFINKDAQMLRLIPLAVMVLYLLRCAAMFGQSYLMSYVGQNLIRRLRNRLYERIMEMPLSFVHKERTGVLMSRIISDVNIINGMVQNLVSGSLRDCFTIFGLIFVIFYQIWDLAMIAFLVLPVAFYPIVAFGRRIRRVSTGCQEAMADMSAFLHETFLGTKIVKAFGMEPFENERFRKKTRKLFNLQIKEVAIKAVSSPVMEFLGGVGIVFIIWYGGSQVIAGRYTTGTFLSFLAAVILLYDPIKKLSKLNNEIQRGLAATDRVYDILEAEPDIVEVPRPREIAKRSHRVSFEKVYFKYDRDMVLKGIDLEVNAGEIVALVGMSGGGKTSLVNLIPRFYDVHSGAVCIDGIDIRQVSLSSLRRQVAVVTQEPILFNDTVFNNIAYGNRDATEHEIRQAAEAAYATGFIQDLPQQFETSIGELGGRLSGGQKQRLCIARALLKDAPILILDEATSSLDTESETLVQRALENLMQGRTTFVIAHRLSTIAYAHRILVIVDGRIVEQGGHQDLLKLDGEYSKLYRMQFQTNGVFDA